tara:strand:- start:283 stop:1044 length:762 start_codon:yes stop_codon:yes gene_type:complete
MKTTFTYPLPTENYVAGISTTRVGTYNYDGPDEIIFQVNDDGIIVDIDPEYEIPEPGKHRIVVSPKTDANHLPVAYYYQDRFTTGTVVQHGVGDSATYEYSGGFVHNYTFEDQVQSNGEVYKSKVNLRLSDAYQLIWDYNKSNGVGVASGNWSFVQKTREETNIHRQRALMYKDQVGIFTDHSGLNSSTHVGVSSYVNELTAFAAANVPLKEWKFNGNTPVVGTWPKLDNNAKLEIESLISAQGLSLLPEEIN